MPKNSTRCYSGPSSENSGPRNAAAPGRLDAPWESIRGIGKSRSQALHKKGIYSIQDALLFLPRTWRRIHFCSSLAEVVAGRWCCTQGRLVGAPRISGRRAARVEMTLEDGTGRVSLCWFNARAAAFRGRFRKGQWLKVLGPVGEYRGEKQFLHPEIESLAQAQALPSGSQLMPVYPEVNGLSPRLLRQFQKQTVEKYVGFWPELLDEQIRKRQGFMPAAEALRWIHFPPPAADEEQLAAWSTPAQRRLVFEELFLLQLELALMRQRLQQVPAPRVPLAEEILASAEDVFGFQLTAAQQKAFRQIAADLASGHPMNRLLQGDVGSGKTAVALLTSLAAARSGLQSALLVPTEILAEQHHRLALERLAPAGLRTGLLCASTPAGERRRILELAEKGGLDLLVGTHALLEQGVRFQRLGLCLIDEQHRFGVAQRARLLRKGERPHLLVMTATPIPRTLALALYGDLEVSVIDQLPPGRAGTKTMVVESHQAAQVWDWVRSRLEQGQQAFVVCPLLDESERSDLMAARSLQRWLRQDKLAGLEVELVHGRQEEGERRRLLELFRQGKIRALVATTVIEVGVDVAAAGIMVIEHAERFGLSQLHQLRGRVGRGGQPAHCILIAHEPLSHEAKRRLEIIRSTNDGFVIAEYDLQLRGPGEALGVRQSGWWQLRFARLERDVDLLEHAAQEAAELVRKDPWLQLQEHRALKERLAGELTQEYFDYRCG